MSDRPISAKLSFDATLAAFFAVRKKAGGKRPDGTFVDESYSGHDARSARSILQGVRIGCCRLVDEKRPDSDNNREVVGGALSLQPDEWVLLIRQVFAHDKEGWPSDVVMGGPELYDACHDVDAKLREVRTGKRDKG